MADIYFKETPTVGELIEHLKGFDSSLPVRIDIDRDLHEPMIEAIYDYSGSQAEKRVLLVCTP